MSDATFKAYSGAGYTHASGGALLEPADFRGFASLLIGRWRPDTQNGRRPDALRAALRYLREHNPLVAETLTCYEREFDCVIDDDLFPTDGGGGSMAVLPSAAVLHPDAMDVDAEGNGGGTVCGPPANFSFQRALHAGAEDPSVGSTGADRGRRLHEPSGDFMGAATSVYEPDASAADDRNQWQNQEMGLKRKRATPAEQTVVSANAKSAAASVDNAVHPTLFPRGEGGWFESENGCSLSAYRKKMLNSVASPYRLSEEVSTHLAPPGAHNP